MLKMVLKLGIHTYQVVTKDDEVCIFLFLLFFDEVLTEKVVGIKSTIYL
jgi:hypothetical protein